MKISSAGVVPDALMDVRYAVRELGGLNISPDLAWSDAPKDTKSFAVTCWDPDAPSGSGWWHWVITDIPTDVTSLAENAPLPEGARAWTNDYGFGGWGGMWPGAEPHRYIFTVVAVGVDRLDVPDEASCANARVALHVNTLDKASFTALFANPAA